MRIKLCSVPSNAFIVPRSRYGPTSCNADSAVNLLVDIVSDQSGKKYNMDHYATRYPTNVLDVADFLVRLACMSINLVSSSSMLTQLAIALPKTRALPPIIHYSAEEPFTKYEMCLVLAKLLGLPHTHITPQADEPKVCPFLHSAGGSLGRRLYLAHRMPQRDQKMPIYTHVRPKISWSSSVAWAGRLSRSGGEST